MVGRSLPHEKKPIMTLCDRFISLIPCNPLRIQGRPLHHLYKSSCHPRAPELRCLGVRNMLRQSRLLPYLGGYHTRCSSLSRNPYKSGKLSSHFFHIPGNYESLCPCKHRKPFYRPPFISSFWNVPRINNKLAEAMCAGL